MTFENKIQGDRLFQPGIIDDMNFIKKLNCDILLNKADIDEIIFSFADLSISDDPIGNQPKLYMCSI
ncbi:MAG: hypothetical protein Hyperionvirus2_203 [Hyperionvirus sp.]|uniref:Uncharacterized protein n=1 Tax=Hyperionvirus sp. TaxID=2487770 RepID=A0A3G5A6G6_9VIRU|nr:MAG: hypothetical protein Hyperionvirus2_203 [Hyperionvirus sp.]